ncbi:MAG TPA: DUF1622 domain-containing protein [Caulobacteraceae bacterium]|nr:DUF1622 domain-containing protein [Caulobacteraceae bacterium]
MHPFLKEFADLVGRSCEAISVVFVALGAIEALARTARRWRDYADLKLKKQIWRRFAASIMLALEFALGADIAHTAIAPSWADIGQLAAIAAIRTFLNFFLERDLDAAAVAVARGDGP